jgi:nucleotide-binding universal stress UspA family protein
VTNLPKKILVSTDGSPGARVAARRAADMSRAFGSELHVVHVMPVSEPYHMFVFPEDADGPSLYEEDREQARELLEKEIAQLRREGGEVAKGYLEEGEPDAEVVDLAEKIGADLIVAGSRGTGTLRRPIGSVSGSIVAHAHCPVLVVRSDEA